MGLARSSVTSHGKPVCGSIQLTYLAYLHLHCSYFYGCFICLSYLFKETDIRAKLDVLGSSPALLISHIIGYSPMACRSHGHGCRGYEDLERMNPKTCYDLIKGRLPRDKHVPGTWTTVADWASAQLACKMMSGSISERPWSGPGDICRCTSQARINNRAVVPDSALVGKQICPILAQPRSVRYKRSTT